MILKYTLLIIHILWSILKLFTQKAYVDVDVIVLLMMTVLRHCSV